MGGIIIFLIHMNTNYTAQSTHTYFYLSYRRVQQMEMGFLNFVRRETKKYELEMELQSIYNSIDYFAKEVGTDKLVEEVIDDVLEEFNESEDIIKVLKREKTDIDIKVIIKFKDRLNEDFEYCYRMMDFM